MAKMPCRHPANDFKFAYISVDDGIGRNDRAAPDRDALQHHRTSCDPDIISNSDRRNVEACLCNGYIEMSMNFMILVPDRHSFSYQCVPADHDPCLRHNGGPRADERRFANAHVRALYRDFDTT